MRAAKRTVVLLGELVVEAVLLGSLFGVLLSHEVGLLAGVVGSILAVPVVLFLYWYYLTRSLVAVVMWWSQKPWIYPTLAATAFVIHASSIFSSLKPSMNLEFKAMEIPFLVGGASLVLICALGGNWLMGKWAKVES